VYTYAINITLNYKCILYIEITYTNYFINNLNIFTSKIPIPSSGVLFIYLSINKKLYYNNSLFLNGSINLTNTGL